KRDEDSKAKHQQREDEMLRAFGHGVCPEIIRDFAEIESSLVGRQLQIQRNQANQGDERSQTQVKCDLERCVILVLAAAPDANHDKGGDQCQFVEKVEEKQVQRRERAEDATGHDQEQDVIFFFPVLDFPGYAGGGEGDDCAHQNQADVDAVRAQPTMNAEPIGAEQG